MQMYRCSSEEMQWQEQVSRTFDYFDLLGAAATNYSLEIVKRHLAGERLLEVGPADGHMTRGLSDLHLTLVEPSETLCQTLRKSFPRAKVVCSLIEDFVPSECFDSILLCHVLDNVRDPEDVVRLTAKWLSAKGRIIAIVSNSESLHRQAAVQMGLLPTVDSFSERDKGQGKRRIFNQEEFRQLFSSAELRIELFGGYWLKPLSNQQMEQWTPEMIDAFFALGERHPEIAAEMYIVAGRQ
jgi:2-polyprenyl-3-methyl-5-hydroxy-6-metoxy-1,4-benzoquinol methylase